MTLWRVSNHTILDGEGGLRVAGRWHTRGRRIVYCAPDPATALLEVLVGAEIDLEDIPTTFRYLEIDVPGSIPAETIETSGLRRGWQRRSEVTRAIGDDWLRDGTTALLRVPSVIVPETWNTLLNPQHRDSHQIRVSRIHEHGLDRRLFRQ